MNEKSDLKLIAIRGLPGSGKSEFAKYLGLNFLKQINILTILMTGYLILN